MNSKPIALIAVLVLALLVAGCGDDDKKATAGNDTGNDTTTQPEATNGPGEDADSGGIPKVTGDLGKKPKIAKPTGDPPSVLVSKDIKKGGGAKAASGDSVTVQYVGIDWTNGEQFDASWDNGDPFEFALGTGSVIQGWDEGVEGMREGGRRVLVIPPGLAYGPQGSPPAIGPNETLVFVVDLEKVGTS